MKLFTSATIKLASWYLLILMMVSLLFSCIIFNIARSEIDARLQGFAVKRGLVSGNSLDKPLSEQMEATDTNLIISLAYLNLVVLLGGGVIAYLLAQRTLEPIEAAHQAQSRFVANASHQLRTPLAIMKAEAELALHNPKTPKSELRQTLASNLEEINRLNELATMLLELSHSERQLSSNIEKFDLVELTNNLISSRSGKERVTLHAPDDLAVTMNRPAVREVIAVLLDNAVKHSPDTSPISLTIKPFKTTVVITVTNHGPGISAKDLPHIFERFYSGQQHANSYGLGLSLAHQLTRALGGHISARSTPGKITTFTLSLPKR